MEPIIFGQKGKPIIILFDEILPLFVIFNFGIKFGHFWKPINFGQKGKPIALLFDEILPLFVIFNFGIKLDHFWNRSFLAKKVSL